MPGDRRERIRPSKRFPVSKKERRRLSRRAEELLGAPVEPSVVERVEYGDAVVYLFDGVPCLVELGDGRLVPHLLCLLRRRLRSGLPAVVVDRGAAAAVGRGATLMVPGIRRVEGEFGPGDLVVIVDEESGIVVAVGEALMSSSEVLERLGGERRGRAVRVLHRPGDLYWRLGESV